MLNIERMNDIMFGIQVFKGYLVIDFFRWQIVCDSTGWLKETDQIMKEGGK